MKKSLGKDCPPPPHPIPYPLKIPKFAGRALRPPRKVCIIGICMGIFLQSWAAE